MYAGETETSSLLYLGPDLVQQDRATLESGANQKRWSIPDVYTAIWWYAGFPNHYTGEAEKATRQLGEQVTEHEVRADRASSNGQGKVTRSSGVSPDGESPLR